MNKGERIGSYILLVILVIIATINIYVRVADTQIITDEMASRATALDSLKNEIPKHYQTIDSMDRHTSKKQHPKVKHEKKTNNGDLPSFN